MSGRYLLDANIVIALFREDGDVVHRVDEADEVFVPVVAVGELIYGAR
jgi:tRNA(fMet)-specific endonuclease VapC